MISLPERIEQLFARDDLAAVREQALRTVAELRHLLNDGAERAATPGPDGWTVNTWVKKGILLAFRLGELSEHPSDPPFSFFDKSTLPARAFDLDDKVRVVPGGTTVRDGAYIAPGVILMPPAFVNIGAYVGEGTLIDSHALVGSCAQIGRRVHLSAAAQIGGVLEPINATPVIVEDDVMIGGNCGVFEGTRIGTGAVLAAGVVLTRSTPVFDLVRECIHTASGDQPLAIPPAAVVVPGSRAVTKGKGPEWGLSLSTPVIVKYRDSKTEAAVRLEDWLR